MAPTSAVGQNQLTFWRGRPKRHDDGYCKEQITTLGNDRSISAESRSLAAGSIAAAAMALVRSTPTFRKHETHIIPRPTFRLIVDWWFIMSRIHWILLTAVATFSHLHCSTGCQPHCSSILGTVQTSIAFMQLYQSWEAPSAPHLRPPRASTVTGVPIGFLNRPSCISYSIPRHAELDASAKLLTLPVFQILFPWRQVWALRSVATMV